MKKILFYLIFLVVLAGCVGNKQSEDAQSDKVQTDDVQIEDNEIKEITETLHVTDRVDFKDMTEISVHESADGCLKAFSWDDSMGGTMRYYNNVYQIKSEGKEYNIIASLDEILASESKVGMGVTRELILGESVEDIKTIYVKGNKPVYLIETFNRFSSQEALICVYAVQIKDNMLVPYPLFKGKPFLSNSDLEKNIAEECYVSVCYARGADWYFNTNFGEGWDWIITYNNDYKQMYVAQTDDEGYGELIDRYYVYEFDGEYYNYVGKGAGFWLHKSLQDYQSLVRMFVTKDYRVRVDKMEDGTYRYACWNGVGDMVECPNLVLYNGVCEGEYQGDAQDLTYTFKHKGYTYIVKSVSLEIIQNGKTILKQEAIRN